ncbi:MAG: CRISPR-associated endonuclease Cas1 [Nitrospirae bacterium]|nr:CRISPR-associated endonuclease Cas1 [Nitrospirota bacterium]
MLHGKMHNNGLLRVKQYEKVSGNLPSPLFAKEGNNTPLPPLDRREQITPPLEKGDRGGFSIQFSLNIVQRKVEGQRELLLYIREQRPDLRLRMTAAAQVFERILEELQKPDIGMDTLRGFEGGASATYFGAYTEAFPGSLEFTGRNRRPPEDPVNAILSLCYTLVHFDIVREIEVIGLDPVIGFYHQFDYGRESLACDLIEPYRPMVDRFAWEIFRERTFTIRDFAMNDERPGCYLKKESRKRFYPMYEEWVQNTRPLWVEDVRELARRIMDGQDTVHKSDE